MAREIKKVELKPVDETPTEESPVYRLDPGSAKPANPPSAKPKPVPVELGTRLEVPNPSKGQTRTHEPNFEQLLDAQESTALESEATWGDPEKSKRPAPWGWFALVGIAIVVGVIWSLTNVKNAQEQIDTIKVQTGALLESEEEKEEDAMKTIERLESAIQQFLAAKSMEEMFPLIRHGDRVRPLMEEYYGRHDFPLHGEIEITSLQPLTLANRANFWMAAVNVEGGKKQPLLLEVMPDNAVLIDWETAVVYQPMDWDEYARTRPAGTTMDFRVHVTADAFYSHEFNDSRKWRSYRLVTANADEVLFGYAESGSETARYLDHYFYNNNFQSASMILRLHLPNGLNSRRGVKIEKVLSSRWMYLESPE